MISKNYLLSKIITALSIFSSCITGCGNHHKKELINEPLSVSKETKSSTIPTPPRDLESFLNQLKNMPTKDASLFLEKEWQIKTIFLADTRAQEEEILRTIKADSDLVNFNYYQNKWGRNPVFKRLRSAFIPENSGDVQRPLFSSPVILLYNSDNLYPLLRSAAKFYCWRFENDDHLHDAVQKSIDTNKLQKLRQEIKYLNNSHVDSNTIVNEWATLELNQLKRQIDSYTHDNEIIVSNIVLTDPNSFLISRNDAEEIRSQRTLVIDLLKNKVQNEYYSKRLEIGNFRPYLKTELIKELEEIDLQLKQLEELIRKSS